MSVSPNSLVTVQTPKRWGVQILPADTTSLKTIATGSANGSKVTAIIAASTDTSARDVQIGITNGGIFYPFATVTVAITAGTVAGTPVADLMAAVSGLPVDNDGQPYFFLLSASDTLQAKMLTTITAAKEVDITAVGGDF